MVAKAVEQPERIDGRRLRGIRTHDAIVDSLLDLIAEGDPSPSAQRVAERANVSVRSVYQHYTDVEGLFQEATQRIVARIDSMQLEIEPSWSLDRRVDRFITERSAIAEMLLPFNTAIQLREPFSDTLRQTRRNLESRGRRRVSTIFAKELGKKRGTAKNDTLSALDLLVSMASWDHLRTSGVSQPKARAAIRTGVMALLS